MIPTEARPAALCEIDVIFPIKDSLGRISLLVNFIAVAAVSKTAELQFDAAGLQACAIPRQEVSRRSRADGSKKSLSPPVDGGERLSCEKMELSHSSQVTKNFLTVCGE